MYCHSDGRTSSCASRESSRRCSSPWPKPWPKAPRSGSFFKACVSRGAKLSMSPRSSNNVLLKMQGCDVFSELVRPVVCCTHVGLQCHAYTHGKSELYSRLPHSRCLGSCLDARALFNCRADNNKTVPQLQTTRQQELFFHRHSNSF